MKTFQPILLTALFTLPCFGEPQHVDQPARIAEGMEEQSSGDFEASLEGGWSSRYIAEGRKVWEDNGVFSALNILSYRNYALEIWQGWSDGSGDREFQGSLQYTVIDEPVSVTLGLTYINDTRGGDDDLDISLSINAPLPFGFEWETEYYYGFHRGGGSYLNTGFARIWETQFVDISLGAHLGSNFGYVVDGHDGADHLVISAQFTRAINECLKCSVGVAQQFQINKDDARDPQDLEIYNGFLYAIAAEYSF